MRVAFLPVSLALVGSPAVAQQQAPVAPITLPTTVPAELTDPAMAERLAQAMQALSSVMLDMKVGEVQAAMEGRKPTRAERNMTVRDLGRRDDPNFERNFKQQIAQSKPMIEGSMKALAGALPEMMGGLQQAARAAQRATANLPSPTYPKR